MSTQLTRSNPAYLQTLDHVYRHYEDAPAAPRSVARARRWELAKTASATSLPRAAVIGRLWGARRGARNFLTFLFHIVRAGVHRRSSD